MWKALFYRAIDECVPLCWECSDFWKLLDSDVSFSSLSGGPKQKDLAGEGTGKLIFPFPHREMKVNMESTLKVVGFQHHEEPCGATSLWRTSRGVCTASAHSAPTSFSQISMNRQGMPNPLLGGYLKRQHCYWRWLSIKFLIPYLNIKDEMMRF